MPRACDLKKGNVVEIDNEIYIVQQIDVKTPSARGAVTLYNESLGMSMKYCFNYSIILRFISSTTALPLNTDLLTHGLGQAQFSG